MVVSQRIIDIQSIYGVKITHLNLKCRAGINILIVFNNQR